MCCEGRGGVCAVRGGVECVLGRGKCARGMSSSCACVQALTAELPQFLLGLLESPLAECDSPAAAKAQIVKALKAMEGDLANGEVVSGRGGGRGGREEGRGEEGRGGEGGEGRGGEGGEGRGVGQ